MENLPSVQGTRVQSLGWEDPLEKRKALFSHEIILYIEIPKESTIKRVSLINEFSKVAGYLI